MTAFAFTAVALTLVVILPAVLAGLCAAMARGEEG